MPTKVCLVKAMVFPVIMYGCELDYQESWGPKNWCFWIVVLKKTLESPLDCKEIQPVHPKGNQSWLFIGRTDAEAETPILWPPDAKNWLNGKDPDARKDWRQEEKGMTENEMVGWHHQLDGHESEQAPGVGDGQGSLACFSPWDRKELDMTERRNWTRRYWRTEEPGMLLSMWWEGDDRGWDGWMASLTRWTWVSVNSGSWWWTGRPGMLWFMGPQRVGHDWATDLIWCGGKESDTT